jgi:hypothetical protein
MCRYEARDTAHFFMIVLPFFVTSIAGIIRSGYSGWLLGWLAYRIFGAKAPGFSRGDEAPLP